MHADMVTVQPDAFPARLAQIPDAPEEVSVRGSLPADDGPWLAVVGSRKLSSYGKRACEHLIGGLAGTETVIVSGLALGADAAAHTAALDADLPTVAVPGSGLNDEVLYPASNRGLAHRILQHGGALLSEFPPDFRPQPHHFLKRNRIMAALADIVLVVEAAERSGSLVTARLAGEYGRDVMAVPGSIFYDTSRGTNQLIRDGAVPATDADAVREMLGVSAPEETSHAPASQNLSSNEQHVLTLLATPQARDDICAHLALPTHETQALLAAMELKGLICESGGAYHRLR